MAASKSGQPSAKINALKVAAFAAVMLVILGGVVQLLTRPVTGETATYTAIFSNISGLRVGDDVRQRGVQVGKVVSTELKQGDEAATGESGTVAAVTFTTQTDHRPTDRAVASVRYQNLTGARFIDLTDKPDERGPGAPRTASTLADGATIGLGNTQSSFDITTVFHGLRPVLSTLSPDDVNLLLDSALQVVQGDGKGIGTLLQSVDRLTTTSNAKQQLLTGMIDNFGTLAKSLGGNSPGLTTLISELDQSAAIFAGYAADIRTWSDDSAQVLVSVNRLLASVGLTPDSNPRLESIVDTGITTAGQLLDIAEMVPVISALLAQPAAAPADTECSRGRATLPPMTSVLVGGQEVVVCNAR